MLMSSLVSTPANNRTENDILDTSTFTLSLSAADRKGRTNPENEVCDYFFCKCHHFMDVRWAVLCHSMAIFTQSMFVSGFIAGSMTTIEQKYELSSHEIGIISVMYDVGQLVLLLPVSHLGSTQWRKMRIESIGLFVMSVAAVMFASPHFATERLPPLPTGALFCNASRSRQSFCRDKVDMEELRKSRWVFWCANLLFGLGASPIFSVGTAYVDENSPQNKGYFYFAVMNSNIFFGAAFGSILVGHFLDIDIDINVAEHLRSLSPTQRSTRLGAWWIGPLVAAAACLVVFLPLAGFPKHMPQFRELQRQRLAQKKDASVEVPLQHSFVESLRLIMKNQILLLVCVSVACELLFFTGILYFGPKYLELTFSVSKSRAPMITGGSTVAAGAMGVLLGGWITRRGNFGLRGNLIMLVSISLFNLLPLCAFLISCTELRVEALKTACNEACHCRADSSAMQVGCGADKKNYLSPCFAGCRTANASGYFNCVCIEKWTKKLPEWTDGYCSTQCGTLMPIFMFIMCIEIFTTCIMSSPGINSVLRCVEEGLQTIALGLTGVCARLFGSVPGPLIFAYLIDSSCASWNSMCGTRGYCKDYNLPLIRHYFLSVILVCKCISSSSMILALLLHLYRSTWLPRKIKAADALS